jgi:hypothetical protein
MRSGAWKYDVDLTPGKFYSMFLDEEASIVRGMDTTDLAFGLFHGQLLKLKANTATFQLADEEGHWKISLNLETGLSTKMGVVISSLSEIEIESGKPSVFAEEEITAVHGEQIDQIDGKRIDVEIEGELNLTASVVHRPDEMVIDIEKQPGSALAYSICGKTVANGHFFAGSDSLGRKKVIARWALFGDVYVGIWFEDEQEFRFSFREPKRKPKL